MKFKKIFGALLSFAGIGGIIYAAVLLAHITGAKHEMEALIIYNILSLIFFTVGLALYAQPKTKNNI